MKEFAYKSNLTRHVKNIHGDRGEKDIRGEALSIDFPRQEEMDEFDDPTQSGGLYGGHDVQSTSQSNFENGDEQVDVASQSDFDDDEQSGALYGGNDVQSTSQSKFENGDEQVDDGSGSDSDDSSQHSDFSVNSLCSNDEEYGDQLRDLYSFWRLEMVKQMKKWSVNKLKNAIPSVFYNLTLISRALSRDDILKSIMGTADHFGEMYCADSNYETLGRAVSQRQNVIRDKLALSAKEPESDEAFDLEFDIWEFINNILDNENVSGSARTKRGVQLILFYMRNADAWRHDSIYRSIKKISKQKVNHMSLQKALKYAIRRKKFEILGMFDTLSGRDDDDTDESESDSDKSESDNDDVFESDIDGVEILKKLAPTVVDSESEMSESNDESNGESENDDVSTAKEKDSKPHNPFIEYYRNQALTCQTYI